MDRIKPHHLDGVVALAAAESTPLKKLKGERDTAFIKRIVCAYLNAAEALGAHQGPPRPTYDDIISLGK